MQDLQRRLASHTCEGASDQGSPRAKTLTDPPCHKSRENRRLNLYTAASTQLTGRVGRSRYRWKWDAGFTSRWGNPPCSLLGLCRVVLRVPANLIQGRRVYTPRIVALTTPSPCTIAEVLEIWYTPTPPCTGAAPLWGWIELVFIWDEDFDTPSLVS